MCQAWPVAWLQNCMEADEPDNSSGLRRLLLKKGLERIAASKRFKKAWLITVSFSFKVCSDQGSLHPIENNESQVGYVCSVVLQAP